MKDLRTRAISRYNNTIGQECYKLYKSAFSWISKSIESGFYIEAISITESLFSDRLESYLSSITNINYGFKTLGKLIKGIELHESDEVLRDLVINDLDNWRKARNKTAHEMVKIEDGKQVTWEERVEINKEVAEQGLQLVRKIDKRIRQLRTQST